MTNLYDLAVYDVDPSQQEVVETPACPVCGPARGRRVLRIDTITACLVRCEQCGLGSLWPQPTPAEILGYYPPAYYGASGQKFEPGVEALVRWVAARQARALAVGLPRSACVLDVGCGRGVLLNALADLGHNACGFEVNESAADGVDPRVDLRVGGNLREACFPADRFDLVVLWHVLEHIPEPRQLLAEIYRVLKPGGRFVVAVPNYSSFQAQWSAAAWFHLDLPRHLYHFPIAALKSILVASGFECISEGHFCLRQNPFGWIQSGLNRWSPFPRNSLYNLLQNRGSSCSVPGRLATRILLRLLGVAAIPPAIALSVFAAAAKRGATVHVVARKRITNGEGVAEIPHHDPTS